VVINLRDARPVWAIPQWASTRIAAAFPDGWDVVVVAAPVDGRGDGGGVSPDALAAADGAEVWFGFGFPRALFHAASAAGRLRWVHTGTAGVGGLLYDELRASDVALTNSAGVHAPPIAETVIGMLLHFARGFDFAVRAQAERAWRTEPFEAADTVVGEVAGTTLGLVGLGGIGREVGRRARALGMHVVATRRSERPGPDGIEVLHGPHALPQLLERSDAVVVAVPATPETRGLIDARALAAMKSSAVLVNVSRGDVVAEDALADVLRAGRIRGAALDVFRTEPLPADSPLWSLPNVLITPHVSGTTLRFWERECALIVENIGRYLAGDELRNLVDKRLGY
jgi:phosphoglycerate dehydrogenase-like enzyme